MHPQKLLGMWNFVVFGNFGTRFGDQALPKLGLI